ncbi:hypothetical protein ONZ43_g1100 [Nemania bipapillata]|uniref:Uncharacterized protein n=1 Tax=Nemania bipapillata TaxID=110536 RepID=A0ACC2J5P0_9PEZI|nr:hypothetical protein ONZ43_g1100 [Nemania bipapillata]
MDSPFPKSSSSPGEGRIVVDLLPNHTSTLGHISYQYPLKLISPSPKVDQASVLVFLLSYGGGLVGGDQVNLSIEVQSGAKLSIVTQGHTKVFQSVSPDVVTRQNLKVHLKKGAALCLLPDPVQPFESSVYEQVQIFNIALGASLCLLDWVTHGRSARGENWSLTRWVGRNELWACDTPDLSKSRLLVRDTIILDSLERSTQLQTLQESMYKHAVVGARDFRSTETREKEAASPQLPIQSWRATRLAQERESNLLWSAASVRGCVIVKFGAATVEAGRNWIGSMLLQEGSIGREFGEQALMCVR